LSVSLDAIYTTGSSGPEIGKELIVRLGHAWAGGDSDARFDKSQANKTAIPESGIIPLPGVDLIGFPAARNRK
jgi:hypothetical protein